MPEIGQTISHYRIVEKIGQGGMGEVYLADDTTLDRKVALKFLPEAFTSDSERMARFEREAKLLASLNHPNIAGIYGLEQADGNRFLVLEYVEGETLQARMTKGALPLEDALLLCRQIAEGLEAAHEKGVIHRDLKPANVMITAEEKVKILDFGLAKALSDETQGIDSSQSPTFTEAMTRPGVILGTAAYMSPEQAKGKSVDKRADIWAFGSILYECLTGKKAFAGETVTETLAAVIKEEPDWNRLPSNLHPRISLLLERCLEKHSKDRYGAISDARVDIQKVLADPGGMFAQPDTAAQSQTRLRLVLPWFAAALGLGLLIAGVAVWMLKPLEPRLVVRLEYQLPEGQELSQGALAVSPDSSLVAYSTPEGLYVRFLRDWTAKLLERTDGALYPFFSPDSQWIGYFSESDGMLKKIDVNGGAPVPLCEASASGGYSWSSDNRIIQASGGQIRWISEEGGDWSLFFRKPGLMLSFPQMLPDCESILFCSGVASAPKIMVYSLRTGESKELPINGGSVRYIKTGHIVYGSGNALYAVPFDPDRLETLGAPRLIVENVMSRGSSLNYSVSDSGTLVYIPGTEVKQIIVWVDREGKEESLAIRSDNYSGALISPDGKKIALTIGDMEDSTIWIWDLVRKNLNPFISDSGASFPLWALNGKQIAFVLNSDRSRSNNIYLKAASGMGEAEILGSYGSGPVLNIPSSWSSDGKTLVFTSLFVRDHVLFYDIGTLSIEGDHTSRILLKEEHIETEPKISPDGNLMAYTSNRSGQAEIWVCPFPEVESGDHKMVSINGGYSALWSPDGDELFYRNGDAVMAVDMAKDPLGRPTELFRGSYLPRSYAYLPAGFNHWDIDLNKKRFLMIKEDSGDSTAGNKAFPKINIVLNWFEELKELVPVQ